MCAHYNTCSKNRPKGRRLISERTAMSQIKHQFSFDTEVMQPRSPQYLKAEGKVRPNSWCFECCCISADFMGESKANKANVGDEGPAPPKKADMRLS